MRKNFEQQLSVGIIPIASVKIPNYKRDELPPTLIALQHIFVTPELNQEVFRIMEESILKDKKKTGRTGMDLWQILVLGIVRMTLNTNYDRLWHHANYDKQVRQIMGIEPDAYSGFAEPELIPYSTIRDNVKLLDEATIVRISEIVVKAGHELVKKKDEKLKLKADTFVSESNVHFPTDLNLLWDSSRKCVCTIEKILKKIKLPGWRKSDSWKKSIKIQCRIVSKVCSGGGKGKEKKVKEQATEYLRLAGDLEKKVGEFREIALSKITDPRELARLISLEYYHTMLNKHIDLIERRIIKGEIIPHADKLFSIFEPHVEWIKKGKANNKVELGHKVLVTTDQFQFIVSHQVVEHLEDVELSLPLVDKLLSCFGETSIESISFDKGFWKKENKELFQLCINSVIMPKKGKKNQAEQTEESSKSFKQLRNKHSAVESNINSADHHGLDRCPDKGLKGFKNYTAMGVLAYNLHGLGNIIITARQKATAKFRKAA